MAACWNAFSKAVRSGKPRVPFPEAAAAWSSHWQWGDGELSADVPFPLHKFTLPRNLHCLTNFTMSNTITLRLPADLAQWLEEESRVTGLPKGRIVKEQLERLRTHKARQPFLDLAGSVEGPPALSSKKGFGT